jgi:hypothetical protein
MDCLGPYAKVQNCPIKGTSLRLTAYATGTADTFFSVPACTRYRGKHVGGFFSTDQDGGIVFHPLTRFHQALGICGFCQGQCKGDHYVSASSEGY